MFRSSTMLVDLTGHSGRTFVPSEAALKPVLTGHALRRQLISSAGVVKLSTWQYSFTSERNNSTLVYYYCKFEKFTNDSFFLLKTFLSFQKVGVEITLRRKLSEDIPSLLLWRMTEKWFINICSERILTSRKSFERKRTEQKDNEENQYHVWTVWIRKCNFKNDAIKIPQIRLVVQLSK